MSEESKSVEQRVVEHVAKKGLTCPYCGSDDIDGGFVEVDNGWAEQEVSCLECDSEWSNVYKLVSARLR